jgi:hypothetical protein
MYDTNAYRPRDPRVAGIVAAIKETSIWKWAEAAMKRRTGQVDGDVRNEDEPLDYDHFFEGPPVPDDHEEGPSRYERDSYHTGPAGSPAGDRLDDAEDVIRPEGRHHDDPQVNKAVDEVARRWQERERDQRPR